MNQTVGRGVQPLPGEHVGGRVETGGVGVDITARRLAEGALSQQAEREAISHRISQAIRCSLDSSEVFHTAVRELGSHLDVDRCLTQFRSLLQRQGIANILSRSAYQTARELPFAVSVQTELAQGSCEPDLHQERRFSVIDAGQLISGAIDRLVLIRRSGQVIAADILDFKTDVLPEGDESALQEISAAYRDQMRSYAKAVGLMYRLSPDRIATRLVLLSVGQVMDIAGERPA